MYVKTISEPITTFLEFFSRNSGECDILLLFNSTMFGQMDDDRFGWTQWRRWAKRMHNIAALDMDAPSTAALLASKDKELQGILSKLPVPSGGKVALVCVSTDGVVSRYDQHTNASAGAAWSPEHIYSFVCQAGAQAKQQSTCTDPASRPVYHRPNAEKHAAKHGAKETKTPNANANANAGKNANANANANAGKNANANVNANAGKNANTNANANAAAPKPKKAAAKKTTKK